MTNEGIPNSLPKATNISETSNAIEASANFEGNESEILFKRLHNPVIKNQLIDASIQDKEDKKTFMQQRNGNHISLKVGMEVRGLNSLREKILS